MRKRERERETSGFQPVGSLGPLEGLGRRVVSLMWGGCTWWGSCDALGEGGGRSQSGSRNTLGGEKVGCMTLFGRSQSGSQDTLDGEREGHRDTLGDHKVGHMMLWMVKERVTGYFGWSQSGSQNTFSGHRLWVLSGGGVIKWVAVQKGWEPLQYTFAKC